MTENEQYVTILDRIIGDPGTNLSDDENDAVRWARDQVVERASRCTCDDFCDDPCPRHSRENQLQEERSEAINLLGPGGDGTLRGTAESVLVDLHEAKRERDEAQARMAQLSDEVETLRQSELAAHNVADRLLTGQTVEGDCIDSNGEEHPDPWELLSEEREEVERVRAKLERQIKAHGETAARDSKHIRGLEDALRESRWAARGLITRTHGRLCRCCGRAHAIAHDADCPVPVLLQALGMEPKGAEQEDSAYENPGAVELKNENTPTEHEIAMNRGALDALETPIDKRECLEPGDCPFRSTCGQGEASMKPSEMCPRTLCALAEEMEARAQDLDSIGQTTVFHSGRAQEADSWALRLREYARRARPRKNDAFE